MLRIAITGGIGSGKTVITNYLEYLGYTIIDADVISREMTGPEGCAVERIIEVFGPDVASIEKGLSREYIRQLIFSNNEMKRKFEDIVTKSVIDTINRILKVYELSGKNVVFVAAPLLFEYDMEDEFDAVWLVVSDEDKRITRVAERDGLDNEMITRIIDSQLSDEEKCVLATDIIENNSAVDDLKIAVNILLDKYKLKT
ncbi:dephospho-CoA kinase [Mogibacterium neglectum]|uniref:dephospho-CoA kinase n=1 Tax=Mogibacterium neglectum TaxID=114528 RepID=UPI00272BC576|nr:dephospho-CoA kinase [Mogibacterium neglectum]WLD75537.1 dephospho-CoA kinase [Mogibacterium neglectum]